MEGCPNEANYVEAIDRDFIGVSPLEQLQRKYFFRDRAPSRVGGKRGGSSDLRAWKPGYELHDKIRCQERLSREREGGGVGH